MGDGWLTYFYRPESFAKSWGKIRDFAKEGGKDPDKLLNASQLPIMIGKSRQAVEGPTPVAELLERLRAMPLPDDAVEAPDVLALPGGVGNVTHATAG